MFGRTPGGEGQYWVVSTTEFIDTGAPGTSGAIPTSASVWTVKNLFELKNARNVRRPEQHFRESLAAGAAGLVNRVDAAQLPGHLHLV